MSLKEHTIRGVGWTTIGRAAGQLTSFVVSIILARLLTPEDFGLFGMVLVFVGFATLFGNLGFGAALVQMQQVEERHLSSVFWLNIITGFVLAVSVLAGSSLVAAFYGEPALRPMMMLLSIGFLVSPIGMVHRAILSRKMDFRLPALIEMAAAFISGGIALTLALNDFGVMSLIWQNLVLVSLTAFGLWGVSSWRPKFTLDISALKELFGFSGNLLGFDVINYWLRKGDDLLIGKVLGSASLGIYSRAYSLMMLPIQQIAWVMGGVMFPALSRVKHDRERVKRIYLEAISMIALVAFPLMLGLLVVSRSFVLVLFGPKWLELIPVLRILCLVGVVQSIGTTVGWIYQSQGRTDWMLRWGIAAGALILASFGAGVWLGSAKAVAGCYAFTTCIVLIYPMFAIPGKLINLTFLEVVTSLSGILGCASLMAALVAIVGMMLPAIWPGWAWLLIQIAVGVGAYVSSIHSFKIRAYVQLQGIIREQWQRRTALRPASMSS